MATDMDKIREEVEKAAEGLLLKGLIYVKEVDDKGNNLYDLTPLGLMRAAEEQERRRDLYGIN